MEDLNGCLRDAMNHFRTTAGRYDRLTARDQAQLTSAHHRYGPETVSICGPITMRRATAAWTNLPHADAPRCHRWHGHRVASPRGRRATWDAPSRLQRMEKATTVTRSRRSTGRQLMQPRASANCSRTAPDRRDRDPQDRDPTDRGTRDCPCLNLVSPTPSVVDFAGGSPAAD